MSPRAVLQRRLSVRGRAGVCLRTSSLKELPGIVSPRAVLQKTCVPQKSSGDPDSQEEPRFMHQSDPQATSGSDIRDQQKPEQRYRGGFHLYAPPDRFTEPH